MPATARHDTPPDYTRQIIIAIALVAVAAMLWRVRDALVIGFGGIVFATLLRAFARPLRRWTHLSERWSVTLAIVLLLAGIALLTWFFGAQLGDQFRQLREQLPDAVRKVATIVEQTPMGKPVVDSLKQALDGEAMDKAGAIVSAVVAGLGNLLIILFAGAYFALDPRLYRQGGLRLLPPTRRPQVERAFDSAGDALSRWLVAQLIVMVCVGTLTGIALGLLGVPLALLLALIVAILEFVPIVGPIVAAIPGVLLAFSKGPQTAIYATLVYIAVQQIESNLLTPLIQRWAVELPPVIALLAIIAGGLLLGPLGVLFATPLAVVTMVFVEHLYVEDGLENNRKTK